RLLAELVHQEPDRAQVHAVDRLFLAEEPVQGLQHEAVAAQCHDDVAFLRARFGIALAQKLERGLCVRSVGGDEMDLHQPPVSDIGRESAGPPWRRSITKSWPFGFLAMAASMAAESSASSSDARNGVRRSAASSWPRHI